MESISTNQVRVDDVREALNNLTYNQSVAVKKVMDRLEMIRRIQGSDTSFAVV